MTSREVLTQAKNSGMALGAFNTGNLELVKAVVEAAKSQQTPVIIEVSAGEMAHFGMKNFLNVVDSCRRETGLTFLTNLDHGSGLEECLTAIKAGFDLVHFDGSKLPLAENIKITKTLVEAARPEGVLVEGEIDRILGQSAPQPLEKAESIQATGHYTDPKLAADFVSQTGVDLLAVFVGNLHGTYVSPPRLDLERLKMVAQAVPCFFSLHGGSGLREEDVRKAIQMGVVKINVNTELRIAFKETLANVLKGSEEVAVYKIMPPVIAAVAKVVEEKIRLFKGEEEAIPKITVAKGETDEV